MTRPDYYKNGQYEVKDVIKAFNLDFNLGNVVKYVARAGKKDGEPASKDLNKAYTYLHFELEDLKRYDKYDVYQTRVSMNPNIYNAYIDSVLTDWGLNSDLSMVLRGVFRSSMHYMVRDIVDDLSGPLTRLEAYNQVESLKTEVNKKTYTKDYFAGWNAALDDVCDYIRSDSYDSGLISVASVIGHCEASYERS